MASYYFTLTQRTSGASLYTGDTYYIQWDTGLSGATDDANLQLFTGGTYTYFNLFKHRTWSVNYDGQTPNQTVDYTMKDNDYNGGGSTGFPGTGMDIPTFPLVNVYKKNYLLNLNDDVYFADIAYVIDGNASRIDSSGNHYLTGWQFSSAGVTDFWTWLGGSLTTLDVANTDRNPCGDLDIPFSATGAISYYNTNGTGYEYILTESESKCNVDVTTVKIDGDALSQNQGYLTNYNACFTPGDICFRPYSGDTADITVSAYENCNACTSAAGNDIIYYSAASCCDSSVYIFTGDTTILGGSINGAHSQLTGITINNECVGQYQQIITGYTTNGSITGYYTPTGENYCDSCTGETPCNSYYYFDPCDSSNLNIYRINQTDYDNQFGGGPNPGNTYRFDDFTGLPDGCYVAVSESPSITFSAELISTVTNIPGGCSDALCNVPVTPTPTPTVSDTPSVTPTNTPTVSDTPSVTPTNTPTVSVSDTPSVTPTNTPTPTISDTPSVTPTNTPTVSVSDTPSVTPTNTPTVSVSDTPGNSSTPTPTVSDTPSVTPTPTPSISETSTPTPTPTVTTSSSTNDFQFEECCGGYFIFSGYTGITNIVIGQTYNYNFDGTNGVCATAVTYSGSGPSYVYSGVGNPVLAVGCEDGECPPCDSPTPTPSVTPTYTPTYTPSPTVTTSNTPGGSSTPTPTVSDTPDVTPTYTPTYTPSVTTSVTPTNTVTPTPSPSDSVDCVEGVTDGTYHYTDCCGFYRSGQSVGEIVPFDPSQSYSGISLNGTSTTQNCDEGDLNYNFSVTGTCEDVNGGVITISPFGGVPPYTIDNILPGTLTGGTSNQPFTWTGLSAGTYTFRLNDSLGESNSEIFINVNIDGCLSAVIDDFSGTTCGFDTGYISISGDSESLPYLIYLYQDGLLYSNVSSPINPTIYQNLPNGEYYATVDDYGGATAQTQTVTISGVSSLDYGLSITNTSSCGVNSGEIEITGLTGSPPYVYLWSNGATGDTITNLSGATYAVTVTDSNNCELIKSGTVTISNGIGLVSYTTTPTSCLSDDGQVIVFITGGTAPYTYLGQNGHSGVTSDTTFNFTGCSSGNFEFTITDSSDCTFTDDVNVGDVGGITSVNTRLDYINCGSLGNVTITVVGNGGPYTYSYTGQTSGGTQSVITSNTQQQFTNLISDTYDYKVEGSNGCCYNGQFIVSATPKFELTITTTGDSCNVGSGVINIVPSSGYTEPLDYILSDGQSIIDTPLSAYTFYNVNEGGYTVQVVDGAGCSVSETVNITGTTGVNVIITVTPGSYTTPDVLSATTLSGVSPFTYLWNDGSTGSTITATTEGTYSVTVTDDNGCQDSAQYIAPKLKEVVESFKLIEVCSDTFVTTFRKKGFEELLNIGYLQLVDSVGGSGCTLTSAVFNYDISYNGQVATGSFYTGYTMTDIPSDFYWGEVIEDVVINLVGISKVEVDVLNNTISITTNGEVCDEMVSISVYIDYDIDCDGLPLTPTPTPTSTPAPTPDLTATPIYISPTPTQTLTPTFTQTPTVTQTPGGSSTPTPTFTQTPTVTQTLTPTSSSGLSCSLVVEGSYTEGDCLLVVEGSYTEGDCLLVVEGSY